MSQFITRAYNRFEVDKKNQLITKLSKEDRLKQESEYYKNIPKEWLSFFPRCINSGKNDDGEYFLKLELFAYDDLGTKLISTAKNKSFKEEPFWRQVAQQLYNILKAFQLKLPVNTSDLREMYQIKTEREYEKLVANFSFFNTLSNWEHLIIDNQRYENFKTVWPKLLKHFDDILYVNDSLAFIHGDMCLSNILCGHKKDYVCLKFIDPRGKFGKQKNLGDFYYDLAKLSHSTMSGYEAIINNKTIVTKKNYNNFDMHIDCFVDYKLKKIHQVFDEEIYCHFDKIKIKLIQGLIYIGMCARHYDSKQRQLYMYLTGIKLLNEVLREIKKDD